MKIRRNNTEDLEKETQLPEDAEPITADEVSGCKFGTACDKIMDAIRELSSYSDDEIATDSIANLSVVLFDLQNGGN